MDTNNEKLLAKEEVFQIVGCAIEVLNADISYPLGGKPSSPFEANEFECMQKAVRGLGFGLMLRLVEGAGLTHLLPVK